MASPAALDRLLRHPAIWRGGARSEVAGECLASGWPVIDDALPGGGWPRGALTEILSDARGVGELRLFMPALVALSRQARWVSWIGAPWVPFAPALAARGLDLGHVLSITPRSDDEALWAAEQLIGCGEAGAVLTWLTRVEERRLRRLQLAAEVGNGLAIVFRPLAHARQSSPAALRLVLEAAGNALRVEVLKCRGRRPGRLVVR